VKLAALAAASVTLVLAAAAGAATRHVVETAVDESVRADFAYDYDAKNTRFTNLHLTVLRNGSVLLDEAIQPPAPNTEVWPARYFSHRKSVAVRDLDGCSEPEVMLDLYSGGAHCCWYTQVYRYTATTNAYLMVTHGWGNADYRSVDIDHDGIPEFVSGDDRFAYAFTDFASSSFPLRVWHYRAGVFDDVTRRFPARIRRDARRQWHWALAKPTRADNRGFLAAWTADRCLLRHCASAFERLEVLRRQGRIGHGWDRTPRRYLTHLRKFLRRMGYLH
jgi:hypothetical protein